MIFGELYKLSKSTAAAFFGKNPYLQRHFCVNFKRKEITSRADFHPESKVKTIPFRQIAAVAYDDKKQVRGNKDCPFSFKFTLIQMQSKTDLFAKSLKECELWQRIICRIVDLNNGKQEPFKNAYSPAYENLLLRHKIDVNK